MPSFLKFVRDSAAEDRSVRSCTRHATDGRCRAQATLRRNPLQRLRIRLPGLLPGCRQNVPRHARSILYFSKDLPCRCGLGNLAQRSGRREVPKKRVTGNFAVFWAYSALPFACQLAVNRQCTHRSRFFDHFPQIGLSSSIHICMPTSDPESPINNISAEPR
jgi:hypothetical protein